MYSGTVLFVDTLSACNISSDESPRHCTCCSFVALPVVFTGHWCGVSSVVCVVLITEDSTLLVCDSSSRAWLSSSVFVTGDKCGAVTFSVL